MKNAITLDTFLLWTMKDVVITKLLCLHPSKYIDFYYGPDCILATYPMSEWASWEVLWWLHMLLLCSPNEQQFHENELSVYLNICATVQPLSSSAYVLYWVLYLTMRVKPCLFFTAELLLWKQMYPWELEIALYPKEISYYFWGSTKH